MFVKNRTDIAVVCRRGELPAIEARAQQRFAAVMTTEAFKLGAGGALEPLPSEELPKELKAAAEAPLWDGTSVTLSGAIRAPERATLARRVELRVGGITRTIVARGRRVWTSSGTTLVPSRPGPWEPLAMRWEEAFGGKHPMAAGRDEATGLPAPEYTAMHPMNPIGKGFFMRARLAEGQEVARLELLEDQIQRFGQPVVPGCFAPCGPEVTGVRLPLDGHASASGAYMTVLCAVHAAPAYLIFAWLVPGTEIEVRGMERDVRLSVVRSGARLRARRPGSGAKYGARLRAAHVDADRGVVFFVWQHLVLTDRPTLPDFEVVRSEENVS